MRMAAIENGMVVNVIETEGQIDGMELVIDDGTAQIGGGWDGERFSPPQISNEEFNAPILILLAQIDAKSIRPLREGDTARVAALETQAAELRLKLRK